MCGAVPDCCQERARTAVEPSRVSGLGGIHPVFIKTSEEATLQGGALTCKDDTAATHVCVCLLLLAGCNLAVTGFRRKEKKDGRLPATHYTDLLFCWYQEHRTTPALSL